MRLRAVIPPLLLAALTLGGPAGCFLDEIDKSVAAYETNKPPPAAPGAAAPAPSGGGSAPAPSAPSGPSWWETAKTLGSEQSDPTIAQCALGGRLEFMRRDDCLARGGQPR